jgi:hypothetical protein
MTSARILVLIGFAFLSLLVHSARAGEVITLESELITLQEKSLKQPYRRRLSLDHSGLLAYEIGRPVTPFFKDPDRGLSLRRYRSGERCFEVAFLSEVNRVRRIKCRDLLQDLHLREWPGFIPTSFREILSNPEFAFVKDFEMNPIDQTHILRGFLHEEGTIRMDQRVLGLSDLSAFPSREFPVSLKGRSRITVGLQSGLEVSHSLELTLGSLGILPEKKINFASRIKRSPDELVFFDRQGKVLFLNRLLIPQALRDHWMDVNPSWTPAMQELANASRVEPVCFRDSIFRGNRDCHHRIESLPLVRYSRLRMLLVDFQHSSVQWVP